MTQDHHTIEEYKAKCSSAELGWKAQHGVAVHCDRLAGEIGIAALKATILTNAGALVALLALIGQLWGRANDVIYSVLNAAEFFAYGLACGTVDFLVAYIYQSILTKVEWIKLERMSGKAIESCGFECALRISAFIMLFLGGISMCCFVKGIFEILRIFKHGVIK